MIYWNIDFKAFQGKFPWMFFYYCSNYTRCCRAWEGSSCHSTHGSWAPLQQEPGNTSASRWQESHHRGDRSSGIGSAVPQPRAAPGKCSPSPQRDTGTALRDTLPFAAQAPAVVCTSLSASTTVTADL